MESSATLLYNVALAVIVLAVGLYWYATSTFDYWEKRGVPYIKPWAFFGSLKDQFLSRRNFVHLFEDIYDAMEGHKFAGYFEATTPALMIRDPALVQRVLVKDFSHFYNRGFDLDAKHDPLSANLVNLKGEEWRFLRYKLTPTFTSGKLKGMFQQMCKCGENLNRYIEEQTKLNTAIEGKTLINVFTLDVIATCAFGIQMSEENEMTKIYRDCVSKFFLPSKFRAFQLTLLFFCPKVAKVFGIKSVPEEVEKITMQIISETLSYRRTNKIKRNDFLQLMLNLQKQEQDGCFTTKVEREEDHADDLINQMSHASAAEETTMKHNDGPVFTDACIAAQSFVFLVAGSETVTSPTSFALFALAQHPQIQTRVDEEIDAILANHNNQWSYQAVKEMVYLDQVIQETLRKYPVAVGAFRKCTKAYKIPDTNVVIEEGTRVFIPIHSIHNDPSYYESPEIFDPGRFADNNFKPSGTFLPFGDGPRICIAMRFAVLEMKVVLARILSQYTVKLNSKTKVPIEYQVASQIPIAEGGLWFDFDKRI